MGGETYRAAGVDIDLVEDAIGALLFDYTFHKLWRNRQQVHLSG